MTAQKKVKGGGETSVKIIISQTDLLVSIISIYKSMWQVHGPAK